MKKVWKFILTNVDALIAILISLLATIFGAFGENQILLLAGISATLAIIAAGLIRDRSDREALARKIAELKSSLPDHASASAFFSPKVDYATRLGQATQIDLCGVTLTTTIDKNYSILRERVESGAHIRVLLIDPNPPSQALNASVQRSDNPQFDTEYYQLRWKTTITDLTNLHRHLDKLKSEKKTSKIGSLSVRLLPYAPSFKIISFDSRKKTGTVYIEIYPHKKVTSMIPIFEVTRVDDKEWHGYFLDQFKLMWDSATPWEPNILSQTVAAEK